MSHRDISMTINFTPSDLDANASIMTVDISPKPCEGEELNRNEEHLIASLQEAAAFLQAILE